MNAKVRTGLILIILGLLMMITLRFLVAFGFVIFVVGVLSMLNSNENKIEKIKWGKKHGKK